MRHHHVHPYVYDIDKEYVESDISLNIQIREFLVYTLCVNVKINMSVVVLGIYT